jgi:hypothetical protein
LPSYLYELNQLNQVDDLCAVNLVAIEGLTHEAAKEDLKATILSHQANAAESRGDAARAIELNKQVYETRLKQNDLTLLYYTASNLGYCNNTANDHKIALIHFESAESWRKKLMDSQAKTDPCPAGILTNKARCLVYLDDFAAVQALLDVVVPGLQSEKPLNSAMLGQ